MTNWLNIEGKTIIVTGGSSGIGKSIVESLLEQHVNVANFDIKDSTLKHQRLLFVKTNITLRQEVEAGVAKVKDHFGTIDGLVNNAGINIPRLLVDKKQAHGRYELSEEVFDKIIAINQKGLYLMTQAVSRILVDQEFKEQLFIREKLRSTIFEYGIAFPHAINKKSAEIILSVGIFRKGISTINGQVQVVLLLAIPQDLTMEKEKELLKLYDQLFAVIGDPEFRSELCRLDDLVELQNWMIRKGVIT